MKIAHCIIVEGDNKLESLKRLLKSTEGLADTVHITTNGGEPDGKQTPVKKVEKWCKKMGYDYSHLPWSEDFSAQRNFNFERAPENTDYIIWSDSDDVIIGANRIRKIARLALQQNYDAVFFTYWYAAEFSGKPSLETFIEPEVIQMRERLIRPRKLIWKKRIHETPVPVDENYKYTQIRYSKGNPIAWLHLGAERNMPEEKMKARMVRNRRLLEMELADERKKGDADPRTLLYLMKIYAEETDQELLEKCIEMGKEYLVKSGWDEERATCCRIMANCMGKLGNSEEAKDFLHKAINEYPHDPLLYLHLSRAYFNLKNYSAMRHWLDIGVSMEVNKNSSGFNNILEMKILAAELNMKYYYLGDKRDINKAWKSARLLNRILPNKIHQQAEDQLYDIKRLNDASKNTHQIIKYLEDTKETEKIASLVEVLPKAIKRLPFANRYYQRYKEPKIWKDNEICYFANFGTEYVGKWDGNSLKTGIGGSETAVIRLSEEWTKQGYKVTVYGDPKEPTEVNGVIYLPYHEFNQRDKFNIFIQWRHNHLVNKVSAKKFYIDLHDVWHDAGYHDKISGIDKIFVKSKYHRTLGENTPDSKFSIISNGI